MFVDCVHRLAYTHHINRRAWPDVWEGASKQQRAAFVRNTHESLARILAEDRRQAAARESGNDDARRPNWMAHPAHQTRDLSAALSLQAADLRYAVQALANLGHPASAPRILSLVDHRMVAVRAFAIHALRAVPGPQARRVLVAVMSNSTEDAKVRAGAADALGEWPTEHLGADNDRAGDGGNEVVAAALTQLSLHEGLEWSTCQAECELECLPVGPQVCTRQCKQECEGKRGLEDSIAALLHVRFGFGSLQLREDDSGGGATAGNNDGVSDTNDHAHRAACAASTARGVHADGVRCGHGDHPHPTHVRGARRLMSTLERIEAVLRYSKFQFKAGFSQGWGITAGVDGVASAEAGTGLRNEFDISLGAFSGYFNLHIGASYGVLLPRLGPFTHTWHGTVLLYTPTDNWAKAQIHLLWWTITYLDVKAAFQIGVSYVQETAANLLAGAQAGLGSLVRSARSLGGRVIGYIVQFHERLEGVLDNISGYIDTGEAFIGVVGQYSTISDVVRDLAVEGLQRVKQYTTELLQR